MILKTSVISFVIEHGMSTFLLVTCSVRIPYKNEIPHIEPRTHLSSSESPPINCSSSSSLKDVLNILVFQTYSSSPKKEPGVLNE